MAGSLGGPPARGGQPLKLLKGMHPRAVHGLPYLQRRRPLMSARRPAGFTSFPPLLPLLLPQLLPLLLPQLLLLLLPLLRQQALLQQPQAGVHAALQRRRRRIQPLQRPLAQRAGGVDGQPPAGLGAARARRGSTALATAPTSRILTGFTSHRGRARWRLAQGGGWSFGP